MQESKRMNTNVTMKRTFASSIDKNNIGQNLTFVGWIEDFRDMGKIGFISVRDMTGSFQGVVTGNLLSNLREIPRQSVIMINGIIQDTRAENFQVEVKVEKITVLSKAASPLPIDPTGRVSSSLDKRLDSRALDLRNFRISNIFRTRSNALYLIRKYLFSKMFVEVNTPKIIGSATEGGADLFGFEYFSKKAFLAQSPQLYKEQLTLGLERVFEISSYFRAEPSHTVRHLSEFVSVDLEAAFLEYTDVMDIIEDLVVSTIRDLITNYNNEMKYFGDNKDIMVSKIPRITYEKCLEDLKGLGETIEFGEDLSDPALRKLGEIYPSFYFIVDWPTKLKPFYIHEHEEKPEISKSFDLQYGYLEIVSGGTREHDSVKLKNKLQEKGLNPNSFSDHLQTFEWGMPPHSGCGLGFDRFMMVLTKSANIREVVLYPRDTERLSP
ncbi:MAG TPA: aspartate--tRNA(Asn) ligase [Nitrososphaeraceae archaeon]|nr:aspartate--tRNA(Asn) ligase [Nitrososphaeraceae archaeon]